MHETSESRRPVEDPCVRHYLRYIERYGSLTQEEESGLSLRIMSGDRDALDQLVNANLYHVIHLVRGFVNRGLSDMDAFAVGTLALITAARTFDGRRGIRFITIAKFQIARALRDAIVGPCQGSRRPSMAMVCGGPEPSHTPSPAK